MDGNIFNVEWNVMNVLVTKAVVFVLLVVVFPGCVAGKRYTYDDLRAKANATSLEPTFPAPKSKEITVEPLPREHLIGKWIASQETYIEEYMTNFKRIRIVHSDTETEKTYDFKPNGTYTGTLFNNGQPMTFKGSWFYNDGLLTMIVGEAKVHRKYRVDWLSKDKIAIRWRNDEIGAEFWKGIVQKRKEFKNQKEWVSYNVDKYGCEWKETHNFGDDGGRIIKTVASPSYYTRVIEVSDPITGKPLYDILRCERNSGNVFSYDFTLALLDDKKGSFNDLRTVKNEFREIIKNDYMASTPGVNTCSIHVDFPEFRLEDGKIEGKAIVISMSIVSLNYDDSTHKGWLSARFGAGQYEEAREYVRSSIETLVRDKNIALVTGQLPPKATYYLGKEEVKDGNLLEVEFMAE